LGTGRDRMTKKLHLQLPQFLSIILKVLDLVVLQ
jgi:hypothetical protein